MTTGMLVLPYYVMAAGALELDEISTVTEKYQATIPKRIREKLGLSKGDKLAFEVIEDRVWIRKLMATDIEYLTALNGTMSEWSSIEDNEAYSDF